MAARMVAAGIVPAPTSVPPNAALRAGGASTVPAPTLAATNPAGPIGAVRAGPVPVIRFLNPDAAPATLQARGVSTHPAPIVAVTNPSVPIVVVRTGEASTLAAPTIAMPAAAVHTTRGAPVPMRLSAASIAAVQTSGLGIPTVTSAGATLTNTIPGALARGTTGRVAPARPISAPSIADQHSVPGRRIPVPTARVIAANNEVQEVRAARQAAREHQVRRTEARLQQANRNATVEHVADNAENRRLRRKFTTSQFFGTTHVQTTPRTSF
jgi:hypothetical protein